MEEVKLRVPMMKLMRSAWNIVEDKVSDGANNIEDTMGGALGYEKIN